MFYLCDLSELTLNTNTPNEHETYFKSPFSKSSPLICILIHLILPMTMNIRPEVKQFCQNQHDDHLICYLEFVYLPRAGFNSIELFAPQCRAWWITNYF